MAGAATLAVALAMPGPAHAQAPTSAVPNLGPWPTTRQPAPLPALRSSLPATDDAQPAPVARIRPASADPETDSDAESDSDREPPRAATDAEAEAADEPPPIRDGMLRDDEPPAVVDGPGGEATDVRSEEERRAFAPVEPPAGYDANAFPIELEPAQDRRPARFAALDPYAPTGLRVGSFVLYPEAEIGIAAFDNVLRTSTDRRSDAALETRPSARLVSTWGVHALELGLRGSQSFHDKLPSEDDRAWAAEARGRLDVTRRTNLEASLTHDVSQETRGTINSRATPGGRADVITDRAAAAFNQRFNRLQVQLRGAVAERDYSPEAGGPGGGGAVSNADRDNRQQEVALRATWEFKPELSAFGEVGTDGRHYQMASVSDGIRRNSSGERYRAGVSFGNGR